jgi:hypothetical protein
MNAHAKQNWADAATPDRFSMAIEAGQEEMWLALRDLPRSGFSAAMLADASGASTGKAEFYLAQLARKGIAMALGLSTERVALYSVQRFGIEPEVFNDQGKPDADYQLRRILWEYVRRHKVVSVTALWAFAKEHLDIDKRKVRKFVKRLAAAEYLTELISERGEPEAVFAKHPVRCAGKLPPRFCEAELVYDVNLRAFFGKAMARQVAL